VLLLMMSGRGAAVEAVAVTLMADDEADDDEFRPVAIHRFPFHWTSLPPPENNVSLPTYATLFPPVVKRG
jgi:hypothetical protein